MKVKSWSFIGVVALSLLLVLSGFFLWQIYDFQIESRGDMKKYSMFLNKYKITRSNLWDNAFGQSLNKGTQINFSQKGSQLIIDSKYLAKIGHENQHYEEQTISNVLMVSEHSERKHFVVLSEGNQQVFYMPKKLDTQETKFEKLNKCLQLDNVELTDKLHYFVDKSDNFWLISHPHNNVLFVQIYDCQNNKLVKKIFHEPKHNNRIYMINELIQIQISSNGNYQIKLLTYESHEYIVQFQQKSYEVVSVELVPSHEITSQRFDISQDQTSLISYKFYDPLNKIFQRQFYHLLFKTVQKYMNEIKTLLGAFGIESKELNSFIKEKIKQYERQKNPQYFDYDLQLADLNNNCILNLQYHLQNQNERNSSITRLSNYLLDTKTPVFHNIQNYDQYDIVEILKNQKTPQVQQFKRISIDRGFQKQYTSNYFYSIYHTYPDSKVHFLGLGQKVFYLHPTQASKDDQYLHIRTKTGALILQGSKIKGVYEDRPLMNEQIRQKYYIEANQVVPGIWQAHAGYQALISVLNGKKVELINGLSGKTMLSYDINVKQGYQYAGSYLFNNQWWIVIFNTKTKMSQIVKNQLYVQKAYPKQVDFVRRTYGKLTDSEFDETQDDLLQIFKEYSSQVSSNGIIVLDIFRCLDQFYYIQICDTKGQNFAIARIHFKRLSNRLPKKSVQYSSDLQKRLIVQVKNMVKQTQSTDPLLFVLKGINLYEGIQDLIRQGNFNFKNYQTKNQQKTIAKLSKLNQFDFLPYSVVSHQSVQTVSEKQSESVQQINLLNMRVLIENAKKKFMIETKLLARNRLMYFVIFVIIILVASIVKLLIQNDLQKIKQEREKQNQSKSSQEKKSSSQKDKKKQKTK